MSAEFISSTKRNTLFIWNLYKDKEEIPGPAYYDTDTIKVSRNTPSVKVAFGSSQDKKNEINNEIPFQKK